MFGYILVFLQFGLIAVICTLGIINDVLTGLRIPIVVFSLMIGILAIYSMNFSMSIHPKPKDGQDLVTTGIYKYIRHPAYLAVITFTLSFLYSYLGLILWFGLILVLTIKMQLEEQMLKEKFSSYKEYAKHSKKLIPYIY